MGDSREVVISLSQESRRQNDESYFVEIGNQFVLLIGLVKLHLVCTVGDMSIDRIN